MFESVWDTSSNSRKFYRRGLITESSSTTTYNPTGGMQYTTTQLKTDTNAGLKSVHSDSVVQGHRVAAGECGLSRTSRGPRTESEIDRGKWSGSVYVAEYMTTQKEQLVPTSSHPTAARRPAAATAAMLAKLENKTLPPATFLNQTFAGDPVNVANGNMFRDEVDFTFANPIIPLDFARHYDSQNKLDVGFGVGWVHSFTGFIYEEQDPANAGDKDYVWLRGNGERHTFERLEFHAAEHAVWRRRRHPARRRQAPDHVPRSKRNCNISLSQSPIANSFVDSSTGKKIYSRLSPLRMPPGIQGVTITYEIRQL